VRTWSAMVADGMDVVVLDDLSTGDPRRVPEAPLVVGSIRDRELVSDALRDHHVDGVMHIAGKKQVGESVVDVPSAHNRCRAAHRCVECCRSARCAGRGCGSLMLLDANLLLYAVDHTSPPVRVERALTRPAVILAEQSDSAEPAGRRRPHLAAGRPRRDRCGGPDVCPLAAAYQPVTTSATEQRRHAPNEPRLLKRCHLRRRLERPYVGPGTKVDKHISVTARSTSV